MEKLNMRSIRKILIVSSLGVLLPIVASAQSITDVQGMSPEDRRTYMESMSEDERMAMRDKWRGEFESLSDEEKQAMRGKRAGSRGAGGQRGDREAMRERWESMSGEERAAAREKRGAQRSDRRERWEAMSDEDRAAARAKRGDHKRQRSDGDRHHGDKGERGAMPNE